MLGYNEYLLHLIFTPSPTSRHCYTHTGMQLELQKEMEPWCQDLGLEPDILWCMWPCQVSIISTLIPCQYSFLRVFYTWLVVFLFRFIFRVLNIITLTANPLKKPVLGKIMCVSLSLNQRQHVPGLFLFLKQSNKNHVIFDVCTVLNPHDRPH